MTETYKMIVEGHETLEIRNLDALLMELKSRLLSADPPDYVTVTRGPVSNVRPTDKEQALAGLMHNPFKNLPVIDQAMQKPHEIPGMESRTD